MEIDAVGLEVMGFQLAVTAVVVFGVFVIFILGDVYHDRLRIFVVVVVPLLVRP